jgi:hypothetical protein
MKPKHNVGDIVEINGVKRRIISVGVDSFVSEIYTEEAKEEKPRRRIKKEEAE